MAVSAKKYGKFYRHLYAGELNWPSTTVKLGLVKPAYTFAQDTHEFWSDVVANECGTSGTGYSVGGYALSNKVLMAYDAPNNRTRLDADDLSMTPLTFPAGTGIGPRFGVLYIPNGGANTTWPLIGCVDLGAEKNPDAGPVNITWDATDGVLYDDAAA